MKVLFDTPELLANEPNQESSFIAGYESAGGTWTGEVFVHSTDHPLYTPGIANALAWAYANGITLFSRPSDGSKKHSLFNYYYNLGIQCVMPAGDNAYESVPFDTYIRNAIIIGAGRDINQTGRNIEFFDQDPHHIIRNIANLTQSGAKAFVQGNNVGGDPVASGVNLYFVNWGVLIEGVTGFQYNPSGVYKITDFIEDGWYNKYKFTFNLGTGSYTGGGTARMDFSSNSGPYIAGKLAYIKDTLNCSWWEARYRMRMTASQWNNYTNANGYGIPNVSSAIAYNGNIPEDPFQTLGEVGELIAARSEDKASFEIGEVENALSYKLYKNGEVITTIDPVSNEKRMVNNIQLTRIFKEVGSEYKYKAFRNEQETEFSEPKIINYFKFPGFRFNNPLIPNIITFNYLYQDDTDIVLCLTNRENVTESFRTDQDARRYTEKYFKDYYNQLLTVSDSNGRIYIINVANVTSYELSGDTINFEFGLKALSVEYALIREANEDYQSFLRIYQAYNHLLNPPGKVKYIEGPELKNGVILRAMKRANKNETIVVRAGTYDGETFKLRSDVYLYLEKDAKVNYTGSLGDFGAGAIEDEKEGTIGRIYGFGTINISGSAIVSSWFDNSDIFIQCEKLIGSNTDMMIYCNKSALGTGSRLHLKGKEIQYTPSNTYSVFDYDNYSNVVFELDFVNVNCGATALMYGAGESNSSYIFRNAYVQSYTNNRGNIDISNDASPNNLRFIRIKMINQHDSGNNISLVNLSGNVPHSIKLANCLLSSRQESIASNYAINVELQSKCYAKINKSNLVTLTGDGTLEIDENLKVVKT